MDRIMEISKTKTKTNGLDKELKEIYGIDLDSHIEESELSRKIEEYLQSPTVRNTNAFQALENAIQNTSNLSYGLLPLSPTSPQPLTGSGERKKSATLLEIEKNHSLFLETQGDDLPERVLERSYAFLIEEMDSQEMIYAFRNEEYFPHIELRDIQELYRSRDQARAIVDKVRHKGMKGYEDFKRILGKTSQGCIADYLHKQEEIILMELGSVIQIEPNDDKIELEEKDFSRMSQEIGNNFILLGLELGIMSAKIEQIQMEYPREVSSQIFMMLKEWKKIEGRKATLRRFLEAMTHCTKVAFKQPQLNIILLDIRKRYGSAVPDELASDPRTLELYEAAIREGKERDRNTRVMVVGCYGQGKSSLVRHLTGQSLEGVESTNGIEVQICESIVDTQELWTIKISGDTRVESVKRLATVARLIQNQPLQNQPLEKTEHISPVSSGNSDTLVAQRTTTIYDRLAQLSESEMEVDAQTVSGGVPTKDALEFVEEIKKNKEKENKLQEKTLEINIWDFGGQFVFYATHQLFHSRQAIYILVFDITKGLDAKVYDEECPNEDKGKSMEEYLKFWIGSVHTFVGNEEGTEPPIFLVGTHLDMLDEHTDQDGRFEDVRQLFDADDLCASHIQSKDFAVSNTNPNHATFADIRRAVTAYALKKSAGLFIPAKWIPLERTLKENRNLKIITFEKVKEFDRSNDIPIASEDQLKLFLQYHHEKGTFFYFENESDAINHVVLDPQFLIDAFRCIITADKFCRIHSNLRKLWQKLRNEAVLEKELLEELWERESDKEFMKFKKPLLFFLQKHRIIAEALEFKEASSTPVPLNFYIVPSLLKNTSEGMIDDFLKGKRYTKVSIGYNFEYVSTLCTVYNRVIAAALGRWPILKFERTSLVYENAVVCKMNLSHSGILKRLENSLELLVVSLCPEENVSVRDCDAFRRFVEMIIQEELHKFQTEDFQKQCHGYSEIVRCYDKYHGSSGSKENYKFDTLRTCNKEIIGCPDHVSHSIVIKDIMTEWFNADIPEADVPKRTLTEIELSKLSTSIGKNWEHLARVLGFSDAVIDHVSIDKGTTPARIYEILKRWKAEQLDCATLDVLISAIRECGQILTINSDTLKNLIDGTLLSRQY